MVCKAFLEHYESADAAVAVLKWVDAFELAVEVYYIFKGFGVTGINKYSEIGIVSAVKMESRIQ